MSSNLPATGWHYILTGTPGGRQAGPVTLEELRLLAQERRLGPADVVWHSTLPGWLPAGQVAGLFPAATARGAQGVAPPMVPPPPRADWAARVGQGAPQRAPIPPGFRPAAARRPWLLPLVGAIIGVVVIGGGLGSYFGFMRDGDRGSGPQTPAAEWSIDSMDVLLDVQANGDVVVEERVTFTFRGHYRFVGRSIPLDDGDEISDVEVRDVTGATLPRGNDPGTWDMVTDGDRRIIQVNFDLTDASGTWTFHYRAEAVVGSSGQNGELRWQVLDAETPVRLGSVKVTVRLPGSVPVDKMTHKVLAGSGVQASATSPGPSLMVYQASDIPPYTEFGIVIGFPPSAVNSIGDGSPRDFPRGMVSMTEGGLM